MHNLSRDELEWGNKEINKENGTGFRWFRTIVPGTDPVPENSVNVLHVIIQYIQCCAYWECSFNMHKYVF